MPADPTKTAASLAAMSRHLKAVGGVELAPPAPGTTDVTGDTQADRAWRAACNMARANRQPLPPREAFNRLDGRPEPVLEDNGRGLAVYRYPRKEEQGQAPRSAEQQANLDALAAFIRDQQRGTA